MKILLIGEYSRLHNSLKEGLIILGHDVIITGSGDDFKNYPVDIKFNQHYSKSIWYIIKKVIYKISGKDIVSNNIRNQFNQIKDKLDDFDIVQLINENSFNTIPKIEKKLLSYIFEKNNNVFLLSCGADYISIKHASDDKFKYSILNPYKEKKASKKQYWHMIKYLTEPYKGLHDYVFKHINGVIASDLDYDIPLKNHEKYLGLIPNPINIDKLSFIDIPITEKIIIFHGVNKKNYTKKGNRFFDEALQIIQRKHANKISVITTENLPYNAYIEIYNKAHIVLDQVYAYDQGYNALEAMAKGKVVFTGAEQEWLDYYNLEADTVAINALPDVNKIAEKLEWLILNPEKLQEISKNARAFIEKEHNYITIAEKYIATWQLHSKN